MSSIYFGGSRALPSDQAGLIGLVVDQAIYHCKKIHVGCCLGADQFVALAALGSRASFLSVFAICNSLGVGMCNLTSGIPFLAQSLGAGVHFLAGGNLSLPLKVRLIKRSIAAMQGCESAVFFSPGSGSLTVAAKAVERSIPVYAFTADQFPPHQIPGCVGHWEKGLFFTMPCWQWQPAQLEF